LSYSLVLMSYFL